jgi:hypothetical protein
MLRRNQTGGCVIRAGIPPPTPCHYHTSNQPHLLPTPPSPPSIPPHTSDESVSHAATAFMATAMAAGMIRVIEHVAVRRESVAPSDDMLHTQPHQNQHTENTTAQQSVLKRLNHNNSASQSCKAHEGQRENTGQNQGDGRTLRHIGHIGELQLFTHTRHDNQRQRISRSGTDSINDAL